MTHTLLKRWGLVFLLIGLAACVPLAPAPTPVRSRPVKTRPAQVLQPTARPASAQPPHSTALVDDTSALMKGCATASVWVRFGPGTRYSQAAGLKKGECRLFDARDAAGAWIRLSENDTGKDGKRLWVAAEFVDLEGKVAELRVAK